MREIAALAALTGVLAVGSVTGAAAQSGPIVHRFSTTNADAVSASTLDTSPLDPSAMTATALTATALTATADCGGPSATPVPDGQAIVVSLPPAAPFTVGRINPYVWRHPMVADPSWRLTFEAFMYLPPLAVRAARDGQTTSLNTIVNQVIAFHGQNPDPGSDAYGWDEGTAQRRLQAENCLYSLTHDSRLVPGMTADANVQFGRRYYGPPYRPVHNHGLMANLRLVRAGELLGRSTWVTFALNRMAHEAPLAFSAAGTSWEQSSSYQLLDTRLWQSAADELAQHPAYAATTTAIRAVTTKALRVVGWFTEPDGRFVQIGDSDRGVGGTSQTRPGIFRDDAAGYAMGRWSRTDAATTYYTIRYGPSRRAHGHYDRGGLTWTTFGARVLVGPGRYDYGSALIDAWQRSPIANNVAIPQSGGYNDSASASIVAQTIQIPARAYRVVDLLYGRTHSRSIDIVNGAHRLVVRDAYSGGVAFRQYWHLDQSWRWVSTSPGGTALLFKNASGRHLTIKTTGRLYSLRRGSTTPFAGWNFPTFGVKAAAYQIAIRSYGTSVTTTFTVT
jgi:hypothetical protein